MSTSIGDLLRDRRIEAGVPVNASGRPRRVRSDPAPGKARTGLAAFAGAEVAAGTRARLERTIAFRRITVAPGAPVPPGPSGAWDQDATPEDGTSPEEETGVLLGLLASFTSTGCWFVLWDGWEGLRLDPKQVVMPWLGNHVGGPAGLIDMILAKPKLEALPVQPDDLAVVTGEWGIP